MFKLFVIVMLCVIALHACAADTALYVITLPGMDHSYVALIDGASIHTVNLPIVATDSMYTRIW